MAYGRRTSGNPSGNACRDVAAGAKFAFPPRIRPDRMTAPGWTFHLLLAVGLAGVPAAAQGARRFGALEFSPCALSSPGLPLTIPAQCTSVTVPRGSCPARRPAHRARDRVGAEHGAQAEPDPVFMLAGGPGQSARDSYPAVSPRLPRSARRRHVILLDQRGTGARNPLDCGATAEAGQSDEPPTTRAPEAARARPSAASNGSTPTRASTRRATRSPTSRRLVRGARRGADRTGRDLLRHAASRWSTCGAIPRACAPSCSTASCRPSSRSVRSTRATSKQALDAAARALRRGRSVRAAVRHAARQTLARLLERLASRAPHGPLPRSDNGRARAKTC